MLPVERMARRTLLLGRADGYHRVPSVNRNSDGDFKFNLGNFENDWNDDNCLLCFRYSSGFSRLILTSGREFSLEYLSSIRLTVFRRRPREG